MYTTETNGVNDLTAARRHRHEVQRMMNAAARRPCPKGHNIYECVCLSPVNL